ncbi:MAG: outer membrane protein assembly factor BamA [Candidatus Omnitrophota bacterium]
MFKRSFIVVLAFALFVVFSASVLNAQQYDPGKKRIIEIRIKGNYAISTATILNRLKIKPGDVFEEAALNKELKRLYALGYFSDVFVETEDLPEGVVITFTVVEKPVIKEIIFRGNTKISSNKLVKKLTIQKGDLLDFSRLSQDIAEIRSFYIEQGYYQVSVDYKIETDPETGQADVIFLVNEGQSVKVRAIKFEGNENISKGELEKLMTTKTAWWFIRKGAFDEEKFQADLDRIASYYRSKGYLDARATSKAEYSEDGKDLFLTVVVSEGKLYSIGDIKIEGKLAFPEKEIRDLIKMKSGDALDYQEMKDDVEKIRVYYYDKGYMDADIDVQQKYNPSTDRMDLTYVIDSHDEIYVGKINIVGNTKTRDKVIRREVRLYPGEKYDGNQLKTSKEKIYDLGFFEDVYFETVPTDKKDVKDLNVTVKETKTGEFSFGGGYSSVDAWLGFVQIEQKNFDILNFPTFTGGGQDLIVRAELGTTRVNYQLSWTDPWIFDLPYLFGFDVYRQEYKRSGISGYGYDEIRTGGDLKLGKQLTDWLGTGLIYTLEEVDIDNIPGDATGDLKKEEGANWISRLTWNNALDTRDNKYSPTKGFYATFSLENAGGFLGGDKDFLKGWSRISYYHPLILKDIVLELKLSGGLAKAYADSDEVPIYERFFAGGADTIRGYKERAVGPYDEGANTALGGEAMALGNIETTFPIFKKIVKGAVFYDAGTIWERVGDVFDSETMLKQGAGIGVRVKTPIGPVKLDWGYPLNKNRNDKQEGRFYFSVSHGF